MVADDQPQPSRSASTSSAPGTTLHGLPRQGSEASHGLARADMAVLLAFAAGDSMPGRCACFSAFRIGIDSPALRHSRSTNSRAIVPRDESRHFRGDSPAIRVFVTLTLTFVDGNGKAHQGSAVTASRP